MEPETVVTGAIIDSWIETAEAGFRLVLQVAPRGRPRDLTIVEAEASLVPDAFWLEDLRENMCHGSPVAAIGRRTLKGLFRATHLDLDR